MKKYYFLTLVLTLFISGFSFGQGSEDFTNSGATSSYLDGSFVGNSGVTWTYVASRDGNSDANSSSISLPALMLRRSSSSSKITSSTVTGGIGDFSVKLYKGFTGGGNRQVELFVNGVSKGVSTPFDNFDEQLFTVSGINVTGDVVIEIVNTTSKQVIIDDITWTPYSIQSTINVTTSGGSYGTEKWVNITTAINGAGTQVWGQGNGSYWNGRGLINQNIELSPGTYYVNCYDYYGDGWDGTAISVTSYGSVLASGSPSITGAYLAASYQIVVPNPPSCLPPSSLAASVSSSSEATVSWTAGSSETAWEYVVQAAGTGEPTASGTATTTNPLSLSGLTASTAYEIYVRANCGGDVSSWVSTTFTTQCAVVTAPYSQDFENAGSIPDCWSMSGGEPWVFSTSGGHVGNAGSIGNSSASGGYFAYVDDSSPDNTGTTLQTPSVDVSGLTTPLLSFYLLSNNEGNSNVNFSVDVYDGSSWNTGAYTSNTNTADWVEVTIDLSSLTITGPIKARFIVDEVTSGDYFDDVAIDDVKIIEAPLCQVPTSLTATAISSSEATVSWTAGGSETAWEYVFQALGTGQPTASGTPTTTNSLTLTGLIANTGYEIYVRSDCNGDFSDWVQFTFLSSADCSPNTTAFAQDFQNIVLGSVLDARCWSVLNNGDANGWGLSQDTSGNIFWSLQYSSTAHDDYLYSPIISVVDGVTDGFNFKGWNPLANYPEVIDVLVVDVSGATLGTLATNLLLPGVPSVFTYSLDAYEGQDVRIALHSTSRDQYFARIDDFTVLSPINLTINGVSVDNKTYDGATTGSASGTASLSGVVSGDEVFVSGSPTFTFASVNVGTDITVNTTGYTLSGADAGKYILTQPTLSADITPKALTITGIAGVNKVYDGSTFADSTGAAALLGLETGDIVTLGGTPSFTFASVNAGTGITVNTAGYVISGADSGNYTLTQPTLSADITAKGLTITGISGVDKVYDGTTAASASGTPVLSGLVSGDNIFLVGSPSYAFVSANAGSNITINTSGYSIYGTNIGNYTLIQPDLLADITSKGLTITGISGDDKVYDRTTAASATGTATLLNVVSGDDVSLGGSPIFTFATANVGTAITVNTTGYTISGTALANYTLTQPTLSADITQKELTIIGILADNKVYDGTTSASNSGIANLLGVETGDEVTLGGSPIFSFASANVGTGISVATSGYSISGVNSTNYMLTQPTLSANITQAGLTISATAGLTKVYGASDPTLTYSISGFVNGDTEADLDTGVSISRAAGEDVGIYIISGSATDANYNINFVTNTFSITAAGLTITASAGQTKVYGTADPILAYTISGLVNGDTEASLDTPVTIVRFLGEDVGSYLIIVYDALDSNYNITFGNGENFTITPASLLVTADAGQGKVYGSADPTLTYSISGFVNGDTESDLDTPVMISRAAGEDVGDYAITTSGATDANYTISFVGSTFSITQAGLTVTADAGQGKVYGAIDPVLSYTITGFQGTDNEASLDTGVTIFRVAGENVGDYTITPSGAADSNYSVSFVTSIFTITPAGLTVTADAGLSKVYGTVDPTLTYMITGFQGADTEADLDTPVMIARVAGEDVGAYTITPSGASDSNYSISFVESTFEITQAALLVTADGGFSKVYGTTDPIFTYVITGFIGTDNEASLDTPVSISRAAGEDVGQYIITPSGAADINYSISFVTSTFDITQSALLVTADSGLSKVYGNNDPTLTYMITGFVNGDTEANLDTPVTNTRAVGEDVGTYTITPSGAADINYSISFVDSTFEITPADLIIIGLVGKNKVYDETTVATTTGTAILSGIVSNDDVTLGGSPVFTFESPEPGILIMITTTGYTITGSDSGNYTLTQPTLYADITNPDEDCDGDGIVDSQDSDFSTCASAIRNTTRYGFSPNGDGINDVWTIEKILAYPNNVVKVFNRSGKLVFEQRGYQNDWNGESNQLSGNSNGYKLPVGPYIFMLDLGDGNAFVRGWLYINY